MRRKNKKNLYLLHFSITILFLLAIVLPIYLFLFFYQSQTSIECANSISCINDLSGNYEKNQTKGIFENKPVNVPNEIAIDIFKNKVLGESSGNNKHIYVDLTKQRLYAYENERLVYEFPVSSGKPWTPTPIGDFLIWIKLKYTRMSGGSIENGSYYNLPNVPYTMFYYNNQIPKYIGYSIHGAYWHNNFGNPMSHGCVNMKIEDAEKIYYWADPPTKGNTTYATENDPGTLVTVYGSTPRN